MDICWWRPPDARPPCRSATCCASSRLPVTRIEYVGYRPVLNFEGQLLPVEDTAGVLAAVQRQSGGAVIVVVCREGNRHVGIAVSHVLDVASGSDLSRPAPSMRTDGVTLLKDRVTGIVNLGGVRRCRPIRRYARLERDCGDSWMSTASSERRKDKSAAALMEICSVRLGETLFGMPISHILEIVGRRGRSRCRWRPGFVGGLVHYRGDVLTTVSLRQLLGMPPHEGTQDILVLESPADASVCWWIRWARCSPSPLGRFRAESLHARRAPRGLFAGAYKLKEA